MSDQDRPLTLREKAAQLDRRERESNDQPIDMTPNDEGYVRRYDLEQPGAMTLDELAELREQSRQEQAAARAKAREDAEKQQRTEFEEAIRHQRAGGDRAPEVAQLVEENTALQREAAALAQQAPEINRHLQALADAGLHEQYALARRQYWDEPLARIKAKEQELIQRNMQAGHQAIVDNAQADKALHIFKRFPFMADENVRERFFSWAEQEHGIDRSVIQRWDDPVFVGPMLRQFEVAQLPEHVETLRRQTATMEPRINEKGYGSEDREEDARAALAKTGNMDSALRYLSLKRSAKKSGLNKLKAAAKARGIKV